MLVVGIAGVSGSGKSRFTKALQNHLKDRSSVLSQDNFYCEQINVPFEQREKNNYDVPQAVDFKSLKESIMLLKKVDQINIPTYDFSNHNRSEQTETILKKEILLVEGTMIFCDPELSNLFDLKVFIDTPLDISILRRCKRDFETRGRSLDSIINQYFDTVREGMLNYSIPFKCEADFLVDGSEDVLNSLDEVLEIIKK